METQPSLEEATEDNTPITKPKRRMVLTDEQRKERADRMREEKAKSKKARELEISIREEKALNKLEKLRHERITKYGKEVPPQEPPTPPTPPTPPPPKKKKKVKQIIIQQSTSEEEETSSEDEVVIISNKRKEKAQPITKPKAVPKTPAPQSEPKYTFRFI